MIAPLPSPTEREVYLRELAAEVDVSFETLKQECNEEREAMKNNLQYGDNNPKRWNNGRQQNRQVPTPNLLPAYHAAERKLIAWMLQDDEAAQYVNEHLGEAFNLMIMQLLLLIYMPTMRKANRRIQAVLCLHCMTIAWKKRSVQSR